MQSARCVRSQMERRPFGAQAAEIRRMRRIPAHAGYARTVGFDDDAAADAAVTTGGFDFLHGHTIATDVPVNYAIKIIKIKP